MTALEKGWPAPDTNFDESRLAYLANGGHASEGARAFALE